MTQPTPLDYPRILSDIVAIVTDAKQVPLSRNCAVDRNTLLSLIRELEQALPDDVVNAGSIISTGDQLIDDATIYADSARRDADEYYADTVDAADREAAHIRESAETDAENMRSSAENDATVTLNDADARAHDIIVGAERTANDIVAQAERQASVMVDSAERQADTIVDNARAEADRRVSESEIVSQARTHANRILDDAHSTAFEFRSTFDSDFETQLINLESLVRALADDVVNARKSVRDYIPPAE